MFFCCLILIQFCGCNEYIYIYNYNGKHRNGYVCVANQMLFMVYIEADFCSLNSLNQEEPPRKVNYVRFNENRGIGTYK